MTEYEKYVNSKPRWRWLLGCAMRFRTYMKYERRVTIARKNGAQIGQNVVMPIELAKRANSNLTIGSHTSIQSSNIDTRNTVHIGNQVIMGGVIRL